MTRQEQFFYDNAGFSYDPKTETPEQGRERGAVNLAAAAQWASDNDYSYTWEYDPEGCSGCECGSSECKCASGADHETLICLMLDSDGEVVESLCGICEPSREYSEVVEAELALEAMHKADTDKSAAIESLRYAAV